MNKFLLSIAAICTTGLYFAQQQKAPRLYPNAELNTTAPASLVKKPVQSQGNRVDLWSNDFSDASTWVIDNSGQSGILFGWNINATKDGWWAPAAGGGMTSTSGGANAELVNGDPQAGTQALDVTYTMTTAAPIDLQGNNQVSLQFEQYGARFNDLQEFQISTDGSNFFTVGDNLDKEVLSAGGGSPYPNPDIKLVNLAPFLPASPGNIWIRFSWTSNFAGNPSPNAWVAYGWYIDDVKITTNPDNDIAVLSTYWGTEGLNYTQIPQAQVAPIDFTAEVTNGGLTDQTNVRLNIDVNSGAFTSASAPITLAALATQELVADPQFTPSALGTYNVTRTITADQTDEFPNNNQIAPVSFQVTEHIYARDNGVASGSTTNGTDGFEVGTLYDIWEPALIKAINIRLAGGANGTAVGTEFYARLYDASGEEFEFLSESSFLTATPGMLNTNLVMELNPPVQLEANKTYLVVAGSLTGGLAVSNSGISDPQTSFFLDYSDETWYYTTSTPMVRMNFDPVVSVNTLESVSVTAMYPNPTNGSVTIDYNTFTTDEITISVLDITGKVVYSQVNNNGIVGGQSDVLNLSSLGAGAYYVTLSSTEGTTTMKLIKE